MEPQIVTNDNKGSYDSATKSINDKLDVLMGQWKDLLETYRITNSTNTALVEENARLIDSINVNMAYALNLGVYL